jgi:hypothetical protein
MAAAYVIARRAMGFKEVLPPMEATEKVTKNLNLKIRKILSPTS